MKNTELLLTANMSVGIHPCFVFLCLTGPQPAVRIHPMLHMGRRFSSVCALNLNLRQEWTFPLLWLSPLDGFLNRLQAGMSDSQRHGRV